MLYMVNNQPQPTHTISPTISNEKGGLLVIFWRSSFPWMGGAMRLAIEGEDGKGWSTRWLGEGVGYHWYRRHWLLRYLRLDTMVVKERLTAKKWGFCVSKEGLKHRKKRRKKTISLEGKRWKKNSKKKRDLDFAPSPRLKQGRKKTPFPAFPISSFPTKLFFLILYIYIYIYIYLFYQ